MNEMQTGTDRQPDQNVRNRKSRIDLSHLTVARKLLLITAVAVTVFFATIVTISVNGARDDLVQQGPVLATVFGVTEVMVQVFSRTTRKFASASGMA